MIHVSKRVLLMSVFIGALFNSCQEKQEVKSSDIQDVKKIIESNNMLLSKNIQASKADTIAAMYAQDAYFCPPGENASIGKEAITGWWQGGLEYGLANMLFTPGYFGGNEEIIYETGKVEVRLKVPNTDTTSAEYNKYVHVWKKQTDGSYKLAIDMWNADAAPMDVGAIDF